jgi:hypothetical protein
VCFIGAACGRAADDSERVYEENGVRIVASQRPAWGDGDGWRVSEEPALVIGEATDDPRHLFSTIFEGRYPDGRIGNSHGVGPYKLPDGLIAVGDKGAVAVRIYDENGQFVRAAIQQGEGPAELPFLRELHHCEPGLLAAIGGGLLAVIDGQGDVRGRHFFVENTGRRLYPPLACNRDGRLLAMDRGQTLSAERVTTPGYERSIVHILLLDIDGTIVRDFGEFPGVDLYRYPGGSMARPLGKYTALALTSERAFIGTADEFEIQVWSLEGTLQQRWSRPTGDLSFDEDDIEAFLNEDPSDSPQWLTVEFLRVGIREGASLAGLREVLPETLPTYSRFVVDATDHLWVEHYRFLAREPHLWSIFAPDGSWLGEVEVPSTFDVTDIGRDYVLGVYRNELDEQSVRLYRLIRG